MNAQSKAVDGLIQPLVDALGIALNRPVLLDDPGLTPLAFTRQWDVDTVRSASILGRGAPVAVRKALLAQGIATARDVVHIAPDPELGMAGRICMPVRDGEEVLAYLWLLDHDDILPAADVERIRSTAVELSGALRQSARPPVPDETDLVAALRAGDPTVRDEAAERARSLWPFLDGQLSLILIGTPGTGAADISVAHRIARRLSVGYALVGSAPEGVALVASLADPVLRALGDDLVHWVCAIAGEAIVVGQSASAQLDSLDEAGRQAAVALRVARSRPSGSGGAAWAELGADRLLAQIPRHVLRDVPDALRRLIVEEPQLSETLANFLDTGGDIQATAAFLSLHRSGLYYRLKRIEDLTGLDLGNGDDRLLAHLAIRAERLT